MLDFNNAGQQREIGLIDDGTIAVVQMNVRAANDGWLKRSKAGDSKHLDCEFTVVDGPFAKRKFWTMFTLEGVTEGQQIAGEVSGERLRAILESARGIRPDDKSDEARAGRQCNDYGDFDGLRFTAKIGIEKGKNGFKDKNVLEAAITPDSTAWKKVEQDLRTAKAVASVGSTFGTQASLGPVQQGAMKKPNWA
jgi:hypothetical protein